MKSVTIAAIIVAGAAAIFLILAATRKPSVTEVMESGAEGTSTSTKVALQPTPSQRIAAVEVKESGKSVWDFIDEYTQRREAMATVGQAPPAPSATKSAEEVVKEVVQDIKDDEVAKAVSAACPVRLWRVKYFDKDTRQWEYVTVPAVISTEAIALVKPTVNGALFSADKA